MGSNLDSYRGERRSETQPPPQLSASAAARHELNLIRLLSCDLVQRFRASAGRLASRTMFRNICYWNGSVWG